MPSRTHGEKKGLIPLTQEEMLAQFNTYQILASIQGDSPTVVPFTVDRKPVLNQISNPSNQEEVENITPAILASIVQTKPVALIRAEAAPQFDVVALTRSVAEEESAIVQMQRGEIREEEDRDRQDDDYDEVEAGEYE